MGSMERLGVVADDLTGALDAGVQFAEWGLHTVVVLGDEELPLAAVVVLNTDSRAVTGAEAYRRARCAAQLLCGRIVYKKIDSTLRGNIGSELDGMLDGLGQGRALVAPAFPSAGRTTVNGYHLVHSVPLAESAFAQDPLWPARESHLPTLLSKQTCRTVGHLPLSVVDQGVETVIQVLRQEEAAIVVADAVELEHLHTLAMALARLPEPWLPCGSAGLAEHWPDALGLGQGPQVPCRWSPDPRPVLVVAGSRHPATAWQLQRALEERKLHLVHLLPEGSEESSLPRQVTSKLEQGFHVCLTMAFSAYQEGAETAIAEKLARAAVQVLARGLVAGLVLTGGDIAHAVCEALGATALQVVGEVQAGVPAAILVGGCTDGLRVVTKAGGFGDDLAIVQSVDFIQGR